MKYIVEETGLGKAQQKSERKSLSLGRMLLLSAILESGALQSSKKAFKAKTEELIGNFFYEISRLWNQQIAFRESMVKIIEKGINIFSQKEALYLPKVLSTLTKYILLKLNEGKVVPVDLINTRVSNDADYLCLFFIVKDNLANLPGTSQKDELLQSIDSWTLKANYKTIFPQMKKMLVQDTVVNAFPRPHSCLKHLASFITATKSGKVTAFLWKTVFEEFCFNEGTLYAQDVNKRAKISLNNSGFYLFQYLLENELSSQSVLKLLTPNFIRMWVNRMNKRRTNKLDSVGHLDEKFKSWMEANSKDLEDNSKLDLLKKLFGPNANRRFTFKSNLALFISIGQDMSEELVQEYITYAETMFKNPDLKEFYPEEEQDPESDSEIDEEEMQKVKTNKEDNIRIFLLNMIVNTVMIFKNHSETTLKEVVNFIVYQAFFQENLSDRMKEFAKDKMFALVDNLHKRKSKVDFKDDTIAQNLGLSFTNTFLESKSLWITEVNKTIGRFIAEGNEFNSLDQVDIEKKDSKQPEKQLVNNHKEKTGNPFFHFRN